ncbi:MAG: MBL fold metallo-hydrolase [Eubacteriales bacterium]
MKLKAIKGNTWAIVGDCYMPLYRMNEKDCILMDTGYPKEREELENLLEVEGLRLQGIICSHAHVDHVGSAEYFRKKYKIPLYLSQGEGGILSHILNIKAYRMAISPKETMEAMGDCVSTEAILIPDHQKSVEICGVKFGLELTEGHSSAHLCIITPDDVCYLGDALLTKDQLDAKLPYAMDLAQNLESHKRIKTFPYSHYIMAHFGECSLGDLGALVEDNMSMFSARVEDVYQIVKKGKTMEAIALDFCKLHNLNHRKGKRVYFFQRTLRFYLDYLEDCGRIQMEMGEEGLLYCWCLES